MVTYFSMASSSFIPFATASRRQALIAWISFIFSPVRLYPFMAIRVAAQATIGMTQNRTMTTIFIPGVYGSYWVGRLSKPMKLTATPTTVADRLETSLSTRLNSVPMMPGIYLPDW